MLGSPIAEMVPIGNVVDCLFESVRDRLAHCEYPRRIDFVDELPKTRTGKIQRCKLRGEV